jgi:hypothetical protein
VAPAIAQWAPAGAATRQECNEMMPYTPIDTLRAMHREYVKDTVDPDAAVDRRTNRHRDERPDPIGLAWARLRPRDWVQTVGDWLGRTIAIRQRRRIA